MRELLRSLVSAVVVPPTLAVLELADRWFPIDEDPDRPDGWRR